jgi:hypothetical protein
MPGLGYCPGSEGGDEGLYSWMDSIVATSHQNEAEEQQWNKEPSK